MESAGHPIVNPWVEKSWISLYQTPYTWKKWDSFLVSLLMFVPFFIPSYLLTDVMLFRNVTVPFILPPGANRQRRVAPLWRQVYSMYFMMSSVTVTCEEETLRGTLPAFRRSVTISILFFSILQSRSVHTCAHQIEELTPFQFVNQIKEMSREAACSICA